MFPPCMFQNKQSSLKLSLACGKSCYLSSYSLFPYNHQSGGHKPGHRTMDLVKQKFTPSRFSLVGILWNTTDCGNLLFYIIKVASLINSLSLILKEILIQCKKFQKYVNWMTNISVIQKVVRILNANKILFKYLSTACHARLYSILRYWTRNHMQPDSSPSTITLSQNQNPQSTHTFFQAQC